jgi:hypothetical protein
MDENPYKAPVEQGRTTRTRRIPVLIVAHMIAYAFMLVVMGIIVAGRFGFFSP